MTSLGALARVIGPADSNAGLATPFGVGVALLFAATLWYLSFRPHRPGAATPGAALGGLGAYLSLMKPRIIPLLLVPTGAAMLIAERLQPVPMPTFIRLFILTLIGGTLAAAGAHVFNCYLDRDLDAAMRRTRGRPFPTHRVAAGPALAFGGALTVAAVALLALAVDPLAAALALAGNLFYVLVYSLWLKRVTPQNIVIGGAAGAAPPLVGWAAITHQVGLPALMLFAIIYFWTPAHFWALALVRQEDYKAAGVPMLPVVRGARETRLQIMHYTLLLCATTVGLYLTHAMGALYLIAAGVLGALFILKAAQLIRRGGVAPAWGLFKYSNIYLALLYGAMVLDRLVAH
jgi:protoheme IX farnesyltransferase